MTTILSLLLAAGAAVGILAGLLGVGGGLVLIAVLMFVLPRSGLEPEAVPHVAIGTSLLATVFTAVRATVAHQRRGAVLWPTVSHLVPGLLVGGALGAWIASDIAGHWLQLAVAAYCFIAAAQLLFGQPAARAHADSPRGIGWSVLGVGIGTVSSIVGIGGGSMTVPALIRAGVAPVRAVATSSACGIAIAVVGSLGFMLFNTGPGRPGFVGDVFVYGALAAALGSIVTAPLGATIAHRMSGPSLKRVFAGFLVVLGVVIAAQG